MKLDLKIVAAVLVGGLVFGTGLSYAIPAELRVGAQTNTPGALAVSRAGWEGQQIVGELSGRFYESSVNKQVFSVCTAVAGTTVVAGNNTPPAAAAATILSLYNPAGSGKNMEVFKVTFNQLSGTPAAGGLWLATAFNATITATANATPVSNYASGKGSDAKGFTQTALTGGPAHVTLRSIAGSGAFAGAIAATGVGITGAEDLEGAVVVPPSGVLSVASSGTGTTHIVNACLHYREAPVPQVN